MTLYRKCFVCYYRYTGIQICHGKYFVKSFFFAIISHAMSLLNIFSSRYLFSSSQIDSSKIYVFPFYKYVFIFMNLVDCSRGFYAPGKMINCMISWLWKRIDGYNRYVFSVAKQLDRCSKQEIDICKMKWSVDGCLFQPFPIYGSCWLLEDHLYDFLSLIEHRGL